MHTVRLSVRELAEHACLGGDLLGSRAGVERALEGAAAHRKLQQNYKETGDFESEVALRISMERQGYTLVVEGRADGIRTGSTPQIHEIKTTYLPLESLTQAHYPSYHAQLWAYGFIYAVDHALAGVSLCLTYYNLTTKKTRDFIVYADFEQLAARFNELVEDYARISDSMVAHRQARNHALSELSFPFKSYRPSQLDLARQVFVAAKNKKSLFVQAPTGTGKTAATLFPALKALGAGHCERIFYLTAKTQTALVAGGTLDIMRSAGLPLKSVFITAKDKACLLPKRDCRPEVCPYSRNFLTKQHDFLPEILQQNEFSFETMQGIGKAYELCPFELSLKLSEYCDCIVCDYNYVFNPNIRLKRYFGGGKKGKFVFLIDEAHNLVERARDIFSAVLRVRELAALSSQCKGLPRVYRALRGLEDSIKKLAHGHEEAAFLLEEPPASVYGACTVVLECVAALEEEQSNSLPTALSNLILTLLDFVMVFEHYSSVHCSYMTNNAGSISLHMLCLHTGGFVRAGLDLARSSVLFSATLEPHEYYMNMLGGDENSYYFELPSPFDRDNLLVVVEDGINTGYSARQDAFVPIAERIRTTIHAKKGNYLVFFPSYAFMNSVLAAYKSLDSKTKTVVHVPGMNKQDKDAFLQSFYNESEAVLGFSVLGGHFGEGIDLPGRQLIGAIVVGVGLPMLSPERNLIKGFFDEQYLDGYGYAYVYPGLNRVLQAAGRVIRTETDRGVVLLIDSRYGRPPYDELMPDHWDVRYLSQEDLSYDELLADFWEYD